MKECGEIKTHTGENLMCSWGGQSFFTQTRKATRTLERGVQQKGRKLRKAVRFERKKMRERNSAL
jgi:hypothetical protein